MCPDVKPIIAQARLGSEAFQHGQHGGVGDICDPLGRKIDKGTLRRRAGFGGATEGDVLLALRHVIVNGIDFARRGRQAGFRDQPSLTFAVGLLVLLAGVALLALHHRWRSPAEIALSLIAWLFTLRGALLLLAPDVILDLADRMLVSTPLIVGAGLAAVALGVWLSLVGYRQAAG